MIVCPAKPFDIPSIMNIERQSFIPQIQEKKRVFEKRIKVFPGGFLLLADTSEQAVKESGFAKICGYFSSELWEIFPSAQYKKLIERRFSLGHNPAHTHTDNAPFLYISSFALLKEYRSKGIGEKFFVASVSALCGALKNIRKIILLVNSEWKAAIKIYEKSGFKIDYEIKEFFPTLQKKEFSDGIVMSCDVEDFKMMEFEETNNIFGGIKIE